MPLHLQLPIIFTLILGVTGSTTDDDDSVSLHQGEEFLVSCSAGASYQYCKFNSPTGEFCNFYFDGSPKQFCGKLKQRASFVGSSKTHECALLVRGAEADDDGLWTCEVGSSYSSLVAGQSGWSQIGELLIRIVPSKIPETNNTETESSANSNPVAMTMSRANTALLVICVLVFVVFVAILVFVIVVYRKRKLRKIKSEDTKKVLKDGTESSHESVSSKGSTSDDGKLSGEMSFMKKVFPHIINFPNKDPGLNL